MKAISHMPRLPELRFAFDVWRS